MRYCLLVWSENGEWLDYVSQNGWIPPPPGIWKTKNPGSFRVKGYHDNGAFISFAQPYVLHVEFFIETIQIDENF